MPCPTPHNKKTKRSEKLLALPKGVFRIFSLGWFYSSCLIAFCAG
ncbi:hypothetical protein HMPREF7215_1107 [Pyramidobacter piscolens W5455]|uniref:Uncharacterized protein n=1 Tax=Pyramidobacter piscolens W5455 TaxID=352165 RepID=A0ABM9ZT26_9BACT|nr:hypothetical protein HMPREF7215_1107 [Pyramidobacter piscolens W5455]